MTCARKKPLRNARLFSYSVADRRLDFSDGHLDLLTTDLRRGVVAVVCATIVGWGTTHNAREANHSKNAHKLFHHLLQEIEREAWKVL